MDLDIQGKLELPSINKSQVTEWGEIGELYSQYMTFLWKVEAELNQENTELEQNREKSPLKQASFDESSKLVKE